MIYNLILIFKDSKTSKPIFIATITLDDANSGVLNLVNCNSIILLGSLKDSVLDSILYNINESGYSINDCKITKWICIQNENKHKSKE